MPLCPTRRLHLTVAAGLMLALAGSSRTASAGGGGGGFSWRGAAGPATKAELAYQKAMARADQLALTSAEQESAGDIGRARSMALRAADAYERAAVLEPTRAEPHYRAAELLFLRFVDPTEHPDPRPTRRAIDHWKAFERLAPRDPRLADVLFRRSLAYTKLGGKENFRHAADDYDAEMSLLDIGSADPGEMALLLSNAAEIHMALGDLDVAITYYRASLEHNIKPLYAYGLAVALDRDGQATRAREVMSPFGYDPQVLFPVDGSVFFVPEGDVYWYEALGKELRGEYQSAVNYFHQYLRAQPDSVYAGRAKEKIKRLEALLRAGKGKKGLARQIEPYRIWVSP